MRPILYSKRSQGARSGGNDAEALSVSLIRTISQQLAVMEEIPSDRLGVDRILLDLLYAARLNGPRRPKTPLQRS